MNLIDQGDGAADFMPSCTFPGLSSWKKLLGWKEERSILHCIDGSVWVNWAALCRSQGACGSRCVRATHGSTF